MHSSESMSREISSRYNILEACRHYGVEHLVYASSSSVYGSNSKTPYSTADKVDNPENRSHDYGKKKCMEYRWGRRTSAASSGVGAV